MSAVPQNNPSLGTGDGSATHTFHFKQDVPIPSYLLALAVGQLEHRQIGPRSKVCVCVCVSVCVCVCPSTAMSLRLDANMLDAVIGPFQTCNGVKLDWCQQQLVHAGQKASLHSDFCGKT